jgi:hypothetical protein
MSAQRVLTNVAECCNLGEQGLSARNMKLYFLRSQEYLRLLAALDLAAFEGADDFPSYRVLAAYDLVAFEGADGLPAHRIFRYERRDVNVF